MSSFNRRTLLAALTVSVSGCGFRPLYGADGGSIRNAVALQEAHDPESYAFRERMRRRIGHAGDGAKYGLGFGIAMEETPVAINQASDVTRYQIAATANWRLVELANGAVASEGSVRTNGAYDATAGAFATRAAQNSERERIAIELAELTATRLLASAPGGS